MTNPQDKSWNDAQLGQSQGQQGQSQQNQSQQNQAQQGQQGQQGQSQSQQNQPGIGQTGSADVSGLSPQAGASPNDSSFPTSAGQQGAGSASAGGQQHQFDPNGAQGGGGQQGGSGGSEGQFADQIQPHAEVVDESGNHVGTVDHVEGDRIKLSRKDSPDGEHHYVLLSQVAGIEGDRVRLRERGDNDFGLESGG